MLLMLLGFVISAVSLFFVVAAISDLITGPKITGHQTEAGVLWGLLIFFALTTAGGAYLAINTWLGRRSRRAEEKERRILAVIRQEKGRVTPLDLAAKSDLRLEEAKALLDDLCRRGLGQMQVAETGELVYFFEGVLSAQEKAKAKSPLEV